MEEKNAVLIELTNVSRDQIKTALISAIESLVEKQSQIATSKTQVDWKNDFLSNFEKSSIGSHIQHLNALKEQFD
jgi:hypothetical protein